MTSSQSFLINDSSVAKTRHPSIVRSLVQIPFKINFFFHVFFATAQVVKYHCLKVLDCYLNPFIAAHFYTPVQAKIDDF